MPNCSIELVDTVINVNNFTTIISSSTSTTNLPSTS
ncbi:unnamed protein product, partial [Rotaria sp. Silwood2]